MTRTTRTRKNISTSQWFVPRLRLARSPLDTITKTGGLVNQYNNCYINSCIQCLAHCEPFAQAMLYGTHDCTTKGFCPLCEMKRVTADILKERSYPSSSLTFAVNIPFFNKGFIVGRQQDSHEFLKCLVDKIAIAERSGCLEGIYGTNEDIREDFSSLIEQVFGFTTKQMILCSKCGKESVREEKQQELLLKVTNTLGEKIHSLNEILSSYFSSEVLEGDNAYWCESCKENTKATKKTSLQSGPNVLVINLGRFLNEFESETKEIVMVKLDHFIKFSRRLDVTPFIHEMSSNEELELGRSQYRLSAFLYHVGENLFEGHYVSNVFLPAGCTEEGRGGWWIKNDEVVEATCFQKNIQAYTLFYTREDSQPLDIRGPKKKRISKKTGERRSCKHRLKRKEIKAGEEIDVDVHVKNDMVKEVKERVFLFPRIDMPRRMEWDEVVLDLEDEQREIEWDEVELEFVSED